YWLAEHHLPDSAQTAPEVVLPYLAGHTRRISVGAGGILLRYYRPIKVAETFRVLEALYPGRIDLGLCRGHGLVHAHVASALAENGSYDISPEQYRAKVEETLALLGDGLPSDHPLHQACVWPPGP